MQTVMSWLEKTYSFEVAAWFQAATVIEWARHDRLIFSSADYGESELQYILENEAIFKNFQEHFFRSRTLLSTKFIGGSFIWGKSPALCPPDIKERYKIYTNKDAYVFWSAVDSKYEDFFRGLPEQIRGLIRCGFDAKYFKPYINDVKDQNQGGHPFSDKKNFFEQI